MTTGIGVGIEQILGHFLVIFLRLHPGIRPLTILVVIVHLHIAIIVGRLVTVVIFNGKTRQYIETVIIVRLTLTFLLFGAARS